MDPAQMAWGPGGRLIDGSEPTRIKGAWERHRRHHELERRLYRTPGTCRVSRHLRGRRTANIANIAYTAYTPRCHRTETVMMATTPHPRPGGRRFHYSGLDVHSRSPGRTAFTSASIRPSITAAATALDRFQALVDAMALMAAVLVCV